ncbi:IpaD/SipD/SspD family type III secretion system needle tip protein [Pandoraea pulmonicola]|uniref:IpaD/SipD/SspD family type III secretion system needle tip protein n=1 Tax=Pandoraea pulmonicola TaxID=93221 RepID=UPI00135B6109|nr:IpaD/SipD/SspD family type III secretion system needle tip protein [Pandoraea pulmonicola]
MAIAIQNNPPLGNEALHFAPQLPGDMTNDTEKIGYKNTLAEDGNGSVNVIRHIDRDNADDFASQLRVESRVRDAKLGKLKRAIAELDRHGAQANSPTEALVQAYDKWRTEGVGSRGDGIRSPGIGLRSAEDDRYEVVSDREMFEKIFGVLVGDKATMDAYADIMQTLTEFYSDVSEAIAECSQHMHADADGKNMVVDAEAIRGLLQKVLDKFSVSMKDVSLTAAQAQALQREFGNTVTLKQKADGTYGVVINTGRLQAMIKSLDGEGKDWTIDNAKYQAWWTNGIISEENGIQTEVQTMAEKYSHRITVYDNLVKVLSSTIAAMQEVWKGYLQN